MPAEFGFRRVIVRDDVSGEIFIQRFRMDTGGSWDIQHPTTLESTFIQANGISRTQSWFDEDDYDINHPEESERDYPEDDEEDIVEDRPRAAVPQPIMRATTASTARPRSRPPRNRAGLRPMDERSRRVMSALPLYVEAVKKRVQLWKVMEELSVALEESLSGINRFDVEDSQVDGVASSFEDEAQADALTVEEMCDALRIEYPYLTDEAGNAVPY